MESPMRHLALTAFLPLLFSASLACAADPTQVFVDHNELNYVGPLDEQANAKLFAFYDSLKDKPTTLSIRSPGGPTTQGLALGKWVQDHKLDVKVLEYCMSSCANYVFPAGAHKVVSNFAVIGLHGGLSSTSFSFDEATKKMLDALPAKERQAMLDQIDASIKGDAVKEQAYLKALGVRADYVTLGQQERYQKLYRDDPKTMGWTYSLEDFGRLGIHDISVINPPWRPGAAMKNMSFAVLKLEE
jgi:ATP-dependent protease ClpP protease subunit